MSRILLFLCAVTTASGCDLAGPVAPRPPLQAQAPVLEITKFALTPRASTKGLPTVEYEVALLVTEVGGRGGARIRHLLFVDDLGHVSSEALCNSYVGRGGTWNIVSDYYCEPFLNVDANAREVSVTVTFAGDDGSSGELRKTTDITR